MKYEVLGPLRIHDGRGNRSIGAQKIEFLLATLLVRADRVVTVEELMGEIWGGSLPRRAAAGIHVYVSELRKFLSPQGRSQSPVVTRPPGYLLRLAPGDELDYRTFTELVAAGRTGLREGRYELARDRLERALALWRGPVLAEAGDGHILRSFAAWLAELRLECTELLMEARLQRGEHRESVGQLYSLVAEHPLRETYYRQLMVALYRCGRRADALNVYRSARTTLLDELGLEPGSALRDVHRAILSADEPAYCSVACPS